MRFEKDVLKTWNEIGEKGDYFVVCCGSGKIANDVFNAIAKMPETARISRAERRIELENGAMVLVIRPGTSDRLMGIHIRSFDIIDPDRTIPAQDYDMIQYRTSRHPKNRENVIYIYQEAE